MLITISDEKDFTSNNNKLYKKGNIDWNKGFKNEICSLDEVEKNNIEYESELKSDVNIPIDNTLIITKTGLIR